MTTKGRAVVTSPAEDIQIVRGALWAAFPPRHSPRYTEAHRTVETEATAALDRLASFVGSNSSQAASKEDEVLNSLGKLLGRRVKQEARALEPNRDEAAPDVQAPAAAAPTEGRAKRLPKGTWTRERVIEAVRIWVEEHDGRIPVANDWKRRSEDLRFPAVGGIIGPERAFQSWDDMITAAGFTTNSHERSRANRADGGRIRKWTRERVIEAIQLWASEHDGEPPTVSQWRTASQDGRFPGRSSVAGSEGTPFKSWSEAIEEAGFTPRKRGGNNRRPSAPKPVVPKSEPVSVAPAAPVHTKMTDPNRIVIREREVVVAKRMRSYGTPLEQIAATFRVSTATVKVWLGE